MSQVTDEQLHNTVMQTAILLKKHRTYQSAFQKVIKDLKEEIINPTYSLKTTLTPKERVEKINEAILKAEQGLEDGKLKIEELRNNFKKHNLEILYQTAEVMVDFI